VTELVCETLVVNSTLTWLAAEEYFSEMYLVTLILISLSEYSAQSEPS
jgi:hypothetical protein